MKLHLKNPLVILDLETTGINIAGDRVVEIALLKIHPDGNEEERVIIINPEMPIPEKATRIHGLTNEDVKDAPVFREVAKTLAKFLEGCDLAGFNSNRFDIPLLAEEFIRADVDIDFKKRKFVDVQAIFHKMEKRTLGAAYKFYCNKELTDAHRALTDVRATYEVLQAQLDLYKETEFEDQNGIKSIPVENNIEKLCEFSSYDRYVDYMGRIVLDDNNVPVFNFGKNKGMSVEKVLKEQPGYYGWMLNGDFPLYTKKVLTQIKLKMKER
jgi:DNA polymerase III subunit epsilon